MCQGLAEGEQEMPPVPTGPRRPLPTTSTTTGNGAAPCREGPTLMILQYQHPTPSLVSPAPLPKKRIASLLKQKTFFSFQPYLSTGRDPDLALLLNLLCLKLRSSLLS